MSDTALPPFPPCSHFRSHRNPPRWKGLRGCSHCSHHLGGLTCARTCAMSHGGNSGNSGNKTHIPMSFYDLGVPTSPRIGGNGWERPRKGAAGDRIRSRCALVRVYADRRERSTASPSVFTLASRRAQAAPIMHNRAGPPQAPTPIGLRHHWWIFFPHMGWDLGCAGGRWCRRCWR